MESNILNGNTRAGTVGGTLLVIMLRSDLAEISHTVLMAAIGALVSFSVSAGLKFIIKKFLRK